MMEAKREDFYPKDDSIYIRIQYVKELDGFKFSIWNEFKDGDEIIADNVSILARGMIETCIMQPADIAAIGSKAIVLDGVLSSRNNRINMMMSAKPINEKPI